MRRALVTGAHGLLGAWLTRALLARGVAVVALRRDRPVRCALGLLGLEPEVSTVDGDVRDGELVQRVLAEHEIDTVFHLAAQTLVGVARRSPAGTFDVNVRGTWQVLEACRALEVPRVVVASSDKAYGAQETLPYTEDLPLRPAFPYDASKAAAELIARSYWHTYGVPVAITRCANLYGGGDLNASRLIPEAVGAAIAGRAPVIRSDGSPERDYLYVEDAAAAYLALADALDRPDLGVRGEAFNAGGGRPWAVRDVVALVCRAAGIDAVRPDIRGAGTPGGEIDRQYVDSRKLRARCGWRPEVDLEEGLRRTVDWYRAHPDALAGR